MGTLYITSELDATKFRGFLFFCTPGNCRIGKLSGGKTFETYKTLNNLSKV